MNQNKKACFIIGLPEAGKTTFLAALWHCLNNSTSEMCLKIYDYSGDVKYLSGIGDKWVKYEQMPRTKPEFEQSKITLLLKNNDENIIEFQFPDLSGESFQKQYINREANIEQVELVQKSNGILLFINPLIKEPQFISNIPPEIRGNTNIADVQYSSRKALEHDPTQVQLVELMQFIMFMRSNKPVNLGIIISAWDTVECQESGILPEKFIKNRMPLLWQYLVSNSHSFKTTYYGVSAQGGLLEDERLWDIINPVERINVVLNDGKHFHDITLPLDMMVKENG